MKKILYVPPKVQRPNENVHTHRQRYPESQWVFLCQFQVAHEDLAESFRIKSIKQAGKMDAGRRRLQTIT
ncbi:MAG: hypothetical protein LBJ41_10480 [Treponema sp.]|nr:hypothetical protein [Treponema sp.]